MSQSPVQATTRSAAKGFQKMASPALAEIEAALTTIEYLGFKAEIWHEQGNVHVSIINSDDVLHATCVAPDLPDETLRDLVDDYICVCGSLGKLPSRR